MARRRKRISRIPAVRVLNGMIDEFVGAARLLDRDPRNIVALSDILLSRATKLKLIRPSERIRTIHTRTGLHINYALNPSDLFTIREVFYDEAYGLPAGLRPSVFIDLGANIGLTSLYLHQKYQFSFAVCVEPNPRNIRILKENVAANRIPAVVVEGVVAEDDGAKSFEFGQANGGHVGAGGVRVPAFAMQKLISMTERDFIDLVKMDIEGYEEVVLRRNNEWLERVGCLMIEFHSNCGDIIVDKEALVKILEEKGFFHIPKSWSGVESTFVRPGFQGFDPTDYVAQNRTAAQ